MLNVNVFTCKFQCIYVQISVYLCANFSLFTCEFQCIYVRISVVFAWQFSSPDTVQRQGKTKMAGNKPGKIVDAILESEEFRSSPTRALEASGSGQGDQQQMPRTSQNHAIEELSSIF